jgi:hypothetical protein
MRVRRGEHDPDYFEYEGNGLVAGEAKPRDMTNAEKAALRKREARRVPIGFQLPKLPRKTR